MSSFNAIATRRECLIGVAATLLAGTSHGSALAQALAPIRQGYQTHVWGMPTYYLMRSGLLQKRGIVVEEFGVPSGNLTMQQMVARQVDLGTYAGPSLILGHVRGGVIGVAVVQRVGRTIQVMARKELNITRLEQLRGLKVANQVGSSVGTIFSDRIMPSVGLGRADWQEVRMNNTDMIGAMAAKVVDAMINSEPYNAIAENEGIATTIINYKDYDDLPVFMAATPDFLDKNPDTVVAYLRAWLDVAAQIKSSPQKFVEVVHQFFNAKGYKLSLETMQKALATLDIEVGFPADLEPYMQQHAKLLVRDKRIQAAPAWSKLVRTDFLERARAMG